MQLKEHKTLTTDKWRRFPLAKQILMISNELNRAQHWIGRQDTSEVNHCYERALELLYLTIAVADKFTLRKELLRMRDQLALQYINSKKNARANQALFRILLTLDKDSYNLLKYSS